MILTLLLLISKLEISSGFVFSGGNTDLIILERETTYVETECGVFFRISTPFYLNLTVSPERLSLDFSEYDLHAGGFDISLNLNTRKEYSGDFLVEGEARLKKGRKIGPLLELRGGKYPSNYFKEDEIGIFGGIFFSLITPSFWFLNADVLGGVKKEENGCNGYFKLLASCSGETFMGTLLASGGAGNFNLFLSQDFEYSFVCEESDLIYNKDSLSSLEIEVTGGPSIKKGGFELRLLPGLNVERYTLLEEMNSAAVFTKVEASLLHNNFMFSTWGKFGRRIPESCELMDASYFGEFSFSAFFEIWRKIVVDFSFLGTGEKYIDTPDSQKSSYLNLEVKYLF